MHTHYRQSILSKVLFKSPFIQKGGFTYHDKLDISNSETIGSEEVNDSFSINITNVRELGDILDINLLLCLFILMLDLVVDSKVGLRILLLEFSLQFFEVQDLGVTEDSIDEVSTDESDGLASFLQVEGRSTQEREVNGGVSFIGLEDDVLGITTVDDVLSLEVQDSLFLLLGGVL